MLAGLPGVGSRHAREHNCAYPEHTLIDSDQPEVLCWQDRLALEGDGEGGAGVDAGGVARLAAVAAAEAGLSAADAAAAAAAVLCLSLHGCTEGQEALCRSDRLL